MTASSIASGFPCSRSATIIMCRANRSGTENVSGNEWSKNLELERRADDDVGVVELARDEAAVIPPVEKTVRGGSVTSSS